MFGIKERADCKALLGSLDSYMEQVPQRASYFKEQRLQVLKGEVEDYLGAWHHRLKPDRPRLKDLKRRTHDMGLFVERLGAHCCKVDQLIHECDELVSTVGIQPDSTIRWALEELARANKENAARLGKTVLEPVELENETGELERMKLEIELVRQAMRVMARGERLICQGHWETPLASQVLQQQLDALQQSMANRELYREQLSDLELRMKQLEDEHAVVLGAPLPAEDDNIMQRMDRLQEACDWSDIFDERDLARRIRNEVVRFQTEDNVGLEQEISDQAERLIEHWEKQALAGRQQKVARLERGVQVLGEVGADDQELRERLASLRELSADNPDSYKRFLQEHQLLSTRFTGTLSLNFERIQLRLDKRAQVVRDKLGALDRKPMAPRQRLQLRQLQETAAPECSDEPSALLAAVAALEALESEASALCSEVEAAYREVVDRTTQLRRRYRELEDRVEDMGLELPMPDPPTDNVEADTTVDLLQKRNEQLAAIVAEFEKDIVGVALEAIDDSEAALGEYCKILRGSCAACPCWSPMNGDLAVDPLLESYQQRRDALRQAQKVLEEQIPLLAKRAERAQRDLGAYPDTRMSPEHLRRRDSCVQAFAKLDPRSRELASASKLYRAITQAEQLLAALTRFEKEAEQRRLDLLEGLENLALDAVPDSYAPLINRLSALVWGLREPASTQDPLSLRGQLDHCERMVLSLQLHADRVRGRSVR
jgi:hypothetical protein